MKSFYPHMLPNNQSAYLSLLTSLIYILYFHPSRMMGGLSNAEIQTENRTKNGAVKRPLTRARVSKGLDTERAPVPLLMKQVLHLGNHVQMGELFGKLIPKQEIQYSSLIKPDEKQCYKPAFLNLGNF